MAEVYIYDAVRTPRGKGRADGALHQITAMSLTKQILQAVRDRNGLDTRLVDDIVFGVVAAVGEQGADIARTGALAAGFDHTVPGVQLNRYCASGLEAVNTAAAKIAFGEGQLMIAGGVESMSRVAMGSDGGAFMLDPDVAFANYLIPQGISADLLATQFGFTREDVDRYALQSQQRAAQAWQEGRFARSIVPVKDQLGLTALDRDEHPRPGTTMQSLASLQPAFAQLGEDYFDNVALQRYPEVEWIDHIHHAGNSSGIVDGSAAVLLGTKEMGERLGLKPRARIVGSASIGSEPAIMLTGPTGVTEKLLGRLGMAAGDIDLFELNEAFASVVLVYCEQMKISQDKINVNGGAIAMGHPLGATGAMLLGTALDEIERTGRETALVTLCVGVGMGTAAVIERV